MTVDFNMDKDSAVEDHWGHLTEDILYDHMKAALDRFNEGLLKKEEHNRIHPSKGEHMTECKHRYEPTNFGIRWRTPGSHWYCCTRCGKTIFAVLKEQNA